MVAVHRHYLETSQLCRPPLGLSESLTVPILVQQNSSSLLPKGLEEGLLHVQWQHIPPETRGGCGLHGPLHEQISLEWTGMGSQRWSLHKKVLAQIHIIGRGMAGGRCCTASQVSVLSKEKICKNLETHAQSKTRFQKQGPADLQPFRHDEEYLRCRIRYRILYHILYIVY